MISRCLHIMLMLLLLPGAVCAQELQAKVTVMSQRVYNNIDKKIFITLQNQLTNLLNNRKWTTDTYQPQEKIVCNFLITINDMVEQNVFKASLTVQAARPVYSSSYQAALVNYQDADFTFKYQEFQPVEFNENRIQGSDPLVGNLTATLAFYVNIILGFDYDSFAPKAGAPFFQKAQNIVSNAPESRNITGWRAFDGLRNRYWLAENMINTRYNIIHDVIYAYYRNGLDQLFEKENDGRKSVMEALTRLQAMNQESPNTMILQFFMQSKSQEMIGIFKKAPPQEKGRAADILGQIDIPNLSKYKQELK